MPEQRPEELIVRVIRLEREGRRQRLVLAVVMPFFVLMLISWVRYMFGQGHFWLGGQGQRAHASVWVDEDSTSAHFASGRDTATVSIKADRAEGARCMLTYDGTMAIISAAQGASTLRLDSKTGGAEAAATAAGSGFYVHDPNNNLRAELSLTEKGPARIFYDGSGKVTRRIDAAER